MKYNKFNQFISDPEPVEGSTGNQLSFWTLRQAQGPVRFTFKVIIFAILIILPAFAGDNAASLGRARTLGGYTYQEDLAGRASSLSGLNSHSFVSLGIIGLNALELENPDDKKLFSISANAVQKIKRLAVGLDFQFNSIIDYKKIDAGGLASFAIIENKLFAGAGVNLQFFTVDEAISADNPPALISIDLSATFTPKSFLVFSGSLQLNELGGDLKFNVGIYSGVKFGIVNMGFDQFIGTPEKYRVSASLELQAGKYFMPRIGFNFNELSMGVGIRTGKKLLFQDMVLDYAFIYHRFLGPKNAFSMKIIY